jgi:hypothetical protein
MKATRFPEPRTSGFSEVKGQVLELVGLQSARW